MITKKYAALARVLLCLTFCLASLLGASAVAGEGGGQISQLGKVGYVDFNKALNSVSDGKRIKDKLREEFREKQDKLGEIQDELGKLRDEIDKQRAELSSDKLKQKEERYRSKFFELQQMYASFRQEMESREDNLTKEVLDKLKGIVREIGAEEGYSLILETSQEVVVYAPPNSDLTDRVIATYDGKYQKKRR
jgi:outer membrane protein